MIKSFFSNFAADKNECETKVYHKNLSIGLLMGNFRRKKIIETLKNQDLNKYQKNMVLESYDDYIKQFYSGADPLNLTIEPSNKQKQPLQENLNKVQLRLDVEEVEQ